MARLFGYLSFDPSFRGEEWLSAAAASLQIPAAGSARTVTKAGDAVFGVTLVERGADDRSLQRRIVSGPDRVCVFDGRVDRSGVRDMGLAPAEQVADELAADWARAPVRFLGGLAGPCAGGSFRPDTQELCFFRDRFGARALYWWRNEGVTLFGSELKGLLACPRVSREVNLSLVGRYLSTNYRMWFGRRETFFRHIEELPMSSFASATRDGITVGRYWSPPDSELPAGVDDREYVEEYMRLLDASMQKALERSDRRVFLVSGGLDAPVVAARAHVLLKEPVDCCAAVFPGHPHHDESEWIDALCERISGGAARVYRQRPTPESFLKTFEELIARHDQPLISPTYVVTWELLALLQQEGHGAVFGGGGGDIVSQGCLEYQPYLLGDYRSMGPRVYSREADAWCRRLNGLLRTWPAERNPLDALVHELCDPSVPGRIRNLADWVHVDRTLFGPALDGTEVVAPAVGVHLGTYRQSRIAEDLFHQAIAGHFVEDLNSASFAVPGFDPLWDLDLVEFGFQLPVKMLLRDGWTKYAVRQAMRGVLPDSFVERPDKTGLGVPIGAWLRREPLAGALRRALESPVFLRAGWLDVEGILDTAERHWAGDAESGGLLWNVFALVRWAEHWLPAP